MKTLVKRLFSEAAVLRIQKIWREFRRNRIRFYHRSANLLSLNFSRVKDYYSVLPVLEELYINRERWEKPSRLRGVTFDIVEMETLFAELIQNHSKGILDCETYEKIVHAGYGPGYPRLDAIISYCMLRKLKPARYLEVGSGLSTYIAWLAAQKNAEEGSPLAIRCIEPYPSKQLKSMPGIELIEDVVQNVGIEDFSFVRSGDVLFVDSTHALKIDSDVAYLMMEIIPNVAPGAWVHVHDIPFPYNIPFPASTWVLGDRRPVYWQEAMVLQSFLSFNLEFKIKMSVPLIRHFNEKFISQRIPDYIALRDDTNPPSAIWLNRVTK